MKIASKSSDRVVSNTSQLSTNVSDQLPPMKKKLESQRKRKSRLDFNDEPARANTLARGNRSGSLGDDACVDNTTAFPRAENSTRFRFRQGTAKVDEHRPTMLIVAQKADLRIVCRYCTDQISILQETQKRR